ncbi:MAG TPA: hypothetical protein PKA37_08930 [Planctomycetota bacterium]|nr:hypothetical protein [Planctomycetota bacterium]
MNASHRDRSLDDVVIDGPVLVKLMIAPNLGGSVLRSQANRRGLRGEGWGAAW